MTGCPCGAGRPGSVHKNHLPGCYQRNDTPHLPAAVIANPPPRRAPASTPASARWCRVWDGAELVCDLPDGHAPSAALPREHRAYVQRDGEFVAVYFDADGRREPTTELPLAAGFQFGGGLPSCDVTMPHHLAMAKSPTSPTDGYGCPPGCPRRLAREHRCSSCWEELTGPPRLGCDQRDAHDQDAKPVRVEIRGTVCTSGPGRPVPGHVMAPAPSRQQLDHLIRAGCTDDEHARRAFTRLVAAFGPDAAILPAEIAGAVAGTKRTPERTKQAPDSGNAQVSPPPAPDIPVVTETPQQRARRLDADREEAGRAYRAAVYAADQAWRALGGRP